MRHPEVISMGRQWLILAFTVGRMLMAIGMVAHILACTWFGLGQACWCDGNGIVNQTMKLMMILTNAGMMANSDLIIVVLNVQDAFNNSELVVSFSFELFGSTWLD